MGDPYFPMQWGNAQSTNLGLACSPSQGKMMAVKASKDLSLDIDNFYLRRLTPLLPRLQFCEP